MKIFNLFLVFSIGTFFSFANAQEDLLNQLDSIKPIEKEIETSAFKGLQICNMQSTKMAVKGELYILISHRFGDLTNGFDNFFGLDNANAKIGTVYGLTNWLSASLSRHTLNKIYETALKYKFYNQEKNGFPITIVGYNTLDINSALKTANYTNLKFQNRLAFSTQLLVSRKFSDKFSLQIAPMFVYKNLFDPVQEVKNNFIFSTGGRYKITKRMSINLEYAAGLNKNNGTNFQNTGTIGLDIETGGHVFQMLFSNSQAMSDVAVVTNADGNWTNKGIYFGFNLYRVFN
jgi:Membrane bound beta barrel domain (DUF5777)